MRPARQQIHILLCCNRGYSQHLCVALISILVNSPGSNFDFVVVGREPFGPDEERIRDSLKQFDNFGLRFVVFQTPDELTLPVRLHYSVDTYTRIWVADFFPDDVDRVLYLDADMIAVGDLGPLWRTDLGGKLIGAVSIPGSTRCALLGIPEADGYFNSGVLLFDLAQWRACGAAEEVVRFVVANPDKLIDADQDAINACFHARRHALPFVYNVISPFYFHYHDLNLDPALVAQVHRDAVLVHFNGVLKPWHYMSFHPRAADYYHYLRMSAWRDYVPPDRTPLNIVKRMIASVMPQSLLRALRRGPG